MAAVDSTRAMTASTPRSAATISRHRRNESSETVAVVSTGPVTAPPAGTSECSRRRVSPLSRCTIRPFPAHESAASTPAPPMLDTIATCDPAGTGCVDSSAATSSSSPRHSVAMMPACWNSASRFTSGEATAAVCEAAACWPAADRPASTVSTGMVRPTCRAVRANLRGLPNDSMYSTASLVMPSPCHHISMSLLEMSYLLPIEANEETPMPSRDSRSASAIPRPPDCMTRPAVPGTGCRAAKVASRPMPGTATPKQLGPTSRMP